MRDLAYATARIHELEAKVERLREEHDHLHVKALKAFTEALALQHEVERLRASAEVSRDKARELRAFIEAPGDNDQSFRVSVARMVYSLEDIALQTLEGSE